MFRIAATRSSVAEQELKFGVDVLMGGRKQFFLPEVSAGKRKDGRNLLDEARAAGYTVVGDAEELKAAQGGKILGLFNMGNMVYEIDRKATMEPSLAEMTAKTLDVLSRNPKGFFAMIEGGRIDHAAHRNDAAGTILDTLAFDEAVGVAREFARKNPDTLVIVTADHETAGMALIGHSKDSKEYVGIDLAAIQKAKASFEVIAEDLGKNPTPQKIQAGGQGVPGHRDHRRRGQDGGERHHPEARSRQLQLSVPPQLGVRSAAVPARRLGQPDPHGLAAVGVWDGAWVCTAHRDSCTTRNSSTS